MNRRIWIGLLQLLGGCVPSLHPLYTEKDLTFDPALLGQWTEDDGKGTWAFTKAGEKEYRLVFTDNQGKGGGFQAHLLKIEGRLFLDIFPTDLDLKENDFFRLHLLPAHTFMLVKQVQPSLQMAFLNPDWVEKYLKEHPESIRHETLDDGHTVFTAQPKELQAFVLQHEKVAFGTPQRLTRKAAAKK
jgi:hypothetical protein